MTFTDPIYLLLLVPAIAWVIWLARQIHGMARDRRRVVLALRVLLLVLLIFALAGAQSVRDNRGISTVYVLDRSDSMNLYQDAAESYIRKSMEAAGQNDQVGLVVFGKEPVIDVGTGPIRTLGKIYSRPDASATDLAAAIRLASAMFVSGSGKRIVLVTDGNETAGDASEAADVARADGVQIDYVPPPDLPKGAGEVVVTDLSMPSSVTKGEPFNLRVSAESTKSVTGFLRLFRDGQPISKVPVKLNPGTNSVVVSASAGEPGFYRYSAQLDTDNDTDPRNNSGLGYLSVKGRPRVLLLAGDAAKGKPLADALRKYDLDVVAGGPELLPSASEDLQSFDSILLSDMSASAMTDRQMQLLTASVHDSGIGFGMIGGEDSFLPGGYYQTPIAEALPVDLNVRDRKAFPSTTIMIVVDTSGSMGMIEDGEMKVKIAASAAAATVNTMSANDYVGVAGSTDEIAFVAPIQRAINKGAIAEQIGKLDVGGGGIYIEPSLDFAEKNFANVHTRVKHLILLGDGDDCDMQEGALAHAAKMVAEGITITTVAIGDGKDVQFLKDLARVGKGSYYIALKAHQLQRLMTRDSSIISRSAIEECAFLPKVDPADETLQGLKLNTMPPLYAYDVTSDRPLSRIPMRTVKNDPLLAFWEYGLGTSMAFTSDAQPKWARPWMSWPDFSAFWSQTVRSTLRQASNNRVQMTTRRDGSRGIVDVEAADQTGNPLNGLPLAVRVMGPAGKAADVAVRQIGPGKYEGSFEAPDPGGYIVSAVEREPGGAQPHITRAGFSIAYPPEYQAIHANTTLLAQIAKTTGGEALKSPVDCFRPLKNPGKSSSELWPQLLLLSAILMVLDIAVRRLAIPFGEIAAALQRIFPFLSRKSARRRSARPAATLAGMPASPTRPIAPGGQSMPRVGAPRPRPDSAPVNGGGLGKHVPEEVPPTDVIPTADEPKRALPVSTAERLLAAKRSRQDQNGKPQD